MTHLKDVGWLLLIALLLPMWMAIALVGFLAIVAGHLYLWARGNTTTSSRPASRETAPEPNQP